MSLDYDDSRRVDDPRLRPPVYDPGHTIRFAVRINHMPGGPIIAQR